MRRNRIRENLGMVGSSAELLILFGFLIFVSTIAFRAANDAISSVETALAKLL